MTRTMIANQLTPLKWSLAAVAFEAGLVAAGLGDGPAATWGLALAAVATLVAVLPGWPTGLGPEERDPWRVTPELLERRRRAAQRRAEQPRLRAAA